jgi:hypothetical protein
MGVSVRPATVDDLLAMQRCNLLCLPENYQLKVSLPMTPVVANTPPLARCVPAANLSCMPCTF